MDFRFQAVEVRENQSVSFFAVAALMRSLSVFIAFGGAVFVSNICGPRLFQTRKETVSQFTLRFDLLFKMQDDATTVQNTKPSQGYYG